MCSCHSCGRVVSKFLFNDFSPWIIMFQETDTKAVKESASKKSKAAAGKKKKK